MVRRKARWRLGLVLGLVLVLLTSTGAIAQRVRPDNVWQIIYQQLPDLPRENQYIHSETRQPDLDNTLVGRMIRYHIYVKERPSFFRFDWKITLADYLGINDWIDPTTYPSAKTLQSNPIEGDMAAIRRLSRSQREALVQALTDAFAAQLPAPAPSTSPRAPGSSTSPPTQPAPPSKEPGSADLLRP
jgi:hypothetical protein